MTHFYHIALFYRSRFFKATDYNTYQRYYYKGRWYHKQSGGKLP